MECVSDSRRLRHQDYGKLVDNYINGGSSCGGMELLWKRARGEIDDRLRNDSGGDDHLIPTFCKKQKIETPKVEDRRDKFEAGNQIRSDSTGPCNNFSVVDSAARDIMLPNSSSLDSVLENDKLKNSYLLNCLKQEKDEHVFENPIPGILKVRNAFNKQQEGANNVQSLVLDNTKSVLQKRFAKTDYDMIIDEHEKGSFYNKVRSERYAIFNEILTCKLARGNPVSPHVEKMIGLIERMEKLGSPVCQELAIDIILRSLPKKVYAPFITTFLKCDPDNSMYELHEMLKAVEIHIRETDPSNAISLYPKTGGLQNPTSNKEGKDRGNAHIENLKKPKPQPTPPANPISLYPEKGGFQKPTRNEQAKGRGNADIKNLKKPNPDKGRGNADIKNLMKPNPDGRPKRGAKCDDMCHHCNEFGHWRRNCKKYLEDRKK